MGYSLTISSAEEEFEEISGLVKAFLVTYGDCGMAIYSPDSIIEEDGIVIHGEYGVLDKLLNLLQDERIVHVSNTDEARFMMKWDLVIYAIEQD